MSATEDVGHLVVTRVAASLRRQLGVDLVFVGEFLGDQQVIHTAVGDPGIGIHAGDRLRLADTLCLGMVAGTGAPVVPDTAADRRARRLLRRSGIAVGGYVGVPVRDAEGHTCATLCAITSRPASFLRTDVADVLRAYAPLVADQLASKTEGTRETDARTRRAIDRAIRGEGLRMTFQPIVDLQDGHLVGVEALSVFSQQPARPPDLWFAEADRLGRGEDLEIAAIELALRELDALPDHTYLAVNISPDVLLSGRIAAALADVPPDRVVIELTEHAAIDDYDALRVPLDELRDRGIRLAVDDAGAGFASMRHILELRPEVIKLDGSLTREVDHEPVHAALAQALVGFAAATDAVLIAECIETPDALASLRGLGVDRGQGYLFAAPGETADVRGHYPVHAGAA